MRMISAQRYPTDFPKYINDDDLRNKISIREAFFSRFYCPSPLPYPPFFQFQQKIAEDTLNIPSAILLLVSMRNSYTSWIRNRSRRSKRYTKQHPNNQHNCPADQEDNGVWQHRRDQCTNTQFLVILLTKSNNDGKVRHER